LKWIRYSGLYCFGIVLLLLLLCTAALAQQSPGIQYVYDDLGRLSKVIDPAGNVAEYVYDAVGNILEIKRSTITGLALLNFTPSRGPVGTRVTIQGQGFSAVPAENQVGFHGTLAPVLSATDTQLVVTVPPGATTGPITVTVAGNTASSARNFVMLPSITAINPAFALAGLPLPSVQVQGNNLTGATFTFTPVSGTPVFGPPLVTVTSAAIDPTGTSATLQVTMAAPAGSVFVLVATNTAGRSSAVPSAANTLRILDGNVDTDGDGLTNSDELARGLNPLSADTDGDGFSDSEEVEFGANPLDRGDTPVNISLQIRVASGPPVSMLNSTDPGATPLQNASSPVVSVLNSLEPGTEPAREATGVPVSILNSTDPSGSGVEAAMGAIVSVENLVSRN
jgi:YD repeat-containing protein